MKRTKVFIVLGFLSLGVAGCHTTYTGYYRIHSAQRGQSVRLDDLDEQVGKVVEDFGFRRDKISIKRVRV